MSGADIDGGWVSVSALPAPCAPVTSTLAVAARGHGLLRSLASLGREGCFVGEDDAPLTLGVRAPDRSRAILVVTVDGELAVAVRERVPRGMAVVRDAREADADDIATACLPWPWMVVGSAVTVPSGLASIIRDRPVLTLWLGAPPAGLPGHARMFDRPAALLDAVALACCARVGELRLAPGNGVELRDGIMLRGATLEALVAAYPASIAVPARTSRSIAAALARHDAGWTARRDSSERTTLVASPRPVSR